MSKELETLEKMKHIYFYDEEIEEGKTIAIDLDIICKEEMETIEKALKDKEKIDRALKIIKDKNVFVWRFIHGKEEIKHFEWTYDYYKTHYGYFHSGYKFELLTEEEFELLKEVLL